MSGTSKGAKKAAATIKAKHGKDFYVEIGRKGGKAHNKGGFKYDPKLAAIAGKKGGANSKKGYRLQPDGTYIKKQES